ncbi:MAG: PhoPQ-activated pathogenicity [Kiritimatiellaeota bacterium]|nr:PhoPQ-activated pathogenicity [Kiritimatiellota bacterium]
MHTPFALCSTAVSGIVLQALVAAAPEDRLTALDRYVSAPDENYAYRLMSRARTDKGCCYVLYMASQVWRTGRDVDRILWRHWLEIYVPDRVEHDTALLFITGGKNDYQPPDTPQNALVRIAAETRSVTVRLQAVPNQPLFFLADPELRERSEDAILAFAWAQYLKDGDETWLPLLPMVKSAVRAMDTTTAFCAGLEDGPIQVRRFVVTGASKRGWTSWLTAAADRRVIGVAPIVIDLLNVRASMKHQHRAYGYFSEAVQDYVENGVLDAMDTPRGRAATAIVDPYAYRRRYTMPKLILNSTGDQFFLPDSWRFYWNDLPGPKVLRYVPNTDHGLNDSAYETLATFYASVLKGRPLPRFTWQVEAPGRIRVTARDKPRQVLVWRARNPKARDFRLATIGAAWHSTELAESSPGVYVAEQPAPAQGWAAFVVELIYPDPFVSGRSLRLTTGVSVVPDRLPFAE